jgi:hypothetical protein
MSERFHENLKLFWPSGSWEDFKRVFLYKHHPTLGSHDFNKLAFDLFVCLFIAAWAMFQLSGECHHCWWQGCKFRPMLSTHGFKQWGFFVPHLLRHRTSVYTVSSEGTAPTSHSGIRTGDAKINRSLCLRSNHCTTRAASNLLLNYIRFHVILKFSGPMVL